MVAVKDEADITEAIKAKEPNEEEHELSPLKPNDHNNAQLPLEKHKLSWMDQLRFLKNNMTVEPILACYIMPSVLASLATQNLNLEKACRVNLNYSTEICDALTRRETENYTEHEQEVQKLVASISAWKNVVQTSIPCFLILFVGAWSDKTGRRKACILIPIVGELITALGFILNTYYFYEWPVEVAAMTESIFPAITGGWFTNYIGVFSYIGDITTPENRTYRVGLVNLFAQIGIPIGSALSGVLLSWVGYYGVFSISAMFYLCSLTYGYFCLKDPVRKNVVASTNKGPFKIFKDFFDVKLVSETFKVAFKKGPGNRRLRVCLLIVVVCVVFGPMHGEYTIMYLFARLRFQWDEIQFSYWSTYSCCTGLLGTLFSLNLFTKRLKLDDTLLGVISNTSKIVAAFAYAFARNNLEIYLAPLLEFLNGTSFIAMRSIATKLVSGDEFGKVNSLFGLAEAMMPMIYGPLYSFMYRETMDVLPGAVFLLGALLTVPSLFIFGWLYIMNKKEERKTAEIKTKNGTEAKQLA